MHRPPQPGLKHNLPVTRSRGGRSRRSLTQTRTFGGGGPTDEFTEEPFARRIRSSPRQVNFNASDVGDYLEPDVDHLVELMRQSARERDDAMRVGAVGATYAAQNLSWERVTDRLVEVLFATAAS